MGEMNGGNFFMAIFLFINMADIPPFRVYLAVFLGQGLDSIKSNSKVQGTPRSCRSRCQGSFRRPLGSHSGTLR